LYVDDLSLFRIILNKVMKLFHFELKMTKKRPDKRVFFVMDILENYTNPWSIIESATFTKPATFAPFT
jgi:hypothetical protein